MPNYPVFSERLDIEPPEGAKGGAESGLPESSGNKV
jgi:hypothetical protein